MTKPDFTTLNSGNIVAFLQDIFERPWRRRIPGRTGNDGRTHVAGVPQSLKKMDSPRSSSCPHCCTMWATSPANLACSAWKIPKTGFMKMRGAEILQDFFPTLVTDCVRHHVAAKRYLCATPTVLF